MMSAELWVPECGSMNSDNRSNKIIFIPVSRYILLLQIIITKSEF